MTIFHVIITLIYTVLAFFYNLDVLAYNKLLEGKNSFEVMTYENGTSWHYLTFSILCVFLGIGCIYFIWVTRKYINVFRDLVISFLAILCIIGLIIFTIYSINNPILQSALSVIVAVAIAGIASQS